MIFNSINLVQTSEIYNLVGQVLSAPPASPAIGDIYYNNGTGSLAGGLYINLDGTSTGWVNPLIDIIVGPAGTVTVGTTTIVPTGNPASVTNTGTVSAAILNFAIPAGQPGPLPLQPVSQWTTGYSYTATPPSSFVQFNGSSYECLITHTAGVFATDLASGHWGLIASTGNINFATFSFDQTTGQLVVNLPDAYTGPTFSIDPAGFLEVTI